MGEGTGSLRCTVKIIESLHLIVILSVYNTVQSIKFFPKKRQRQLNAKYSGIYKYAKSTSDANWKSAKSKLTF